MGAEEEEDGEEERLLRPRFEDEEVCLSDAETLGSNGSDELTDYENSGIVEQQRNGVGGEEERQCWVCFASEEDDPVAAWVHPCLCKAPLSGSTRCVSNVGWMKSRKGTTALVSCVLNVALIISYSFLPLRHFFDFWMPWTSWWADCAPLLPVECAWDRSTGLVSHMGPSPSCR